MLVLGYVFAGVQLVGFFGIFKDKPALFKSYTILNSIVLYAGLSVAAAFIGASAGRHRAAADACESSFFASGGQSTTDTEGEQICNVFTWAVLGIMVGLWAVLFIVQVSCLSTPSPHLLIDCPLCLALDLLYFRLTELWCYSKGRSYKVPLHLFPSRRGPEHCAE